MPFAYIHSYRYPHTQALSNILKTFTFSFIAIFPFYFIYLHIDCSCCLPAIRMCRGYRSMMCILLFKWIKRIEKKLCFNIRFPFCHSFIFSSSFVIQIFLSWFFYSSFLFERLCGVVSVSVCGVYITSKSISIHFQYRCELTCRI